MILVMHWCHYIAGLISLALIDEWWLKSKWDELWDQQNNCKFLSPIYGLSNLAYLCFYFIKFEYVFYVYK